MSIQPGTQAPLFDVEDIFSNRINLRDYAGSTVLLSFFRNAACAMCNLRVHQLITRYPDYQRSGLVVLAVFESPRDRMLEYVARQDAPFPLIADPQAQLYDLYAVESSASKLAATMAMPELQAKIQEAAAHGFALVQEAKSNFERMPADFLIGPDLVVRQAHYADYVTDHLSFAAIEQALAMPLSVSQWPLDCPISV